jgi:hypothetical protein
MHEFDYSYLVGGVLRLPKSAIFRAFLRGVGATLVGADQIRPKSFEDNALRRHYEREDG